MKEFIPLNGYIEIEPIKREEIISSQSQRFEEMGKVIGDYRPVMMWFKGEPKYGSGLQDGDIVFFLSHDCWETPEYEGKKRYVVKEDLLLGKI